MNNFSPALQQEMEEVGIRKTMTAGSLVLRENSYIQSIFILVNGSVRIMRTEEEGREILLYYLKPGQSCITSFLSGLHEDTCKVRAMVEEDAEILFIPINKAKEWITKYPEWANFIFHLYHIRFEELLTVINAIAFEQLDDRIMALLNKKKEVYQSNDFTITHQQIAEELGTTREVISRLLKQLEKRGKILLGRNRVILTGAM
ncbi:CRP/FNR family transcriptional regulator, anaerobic regulatory protein [Filimonas lacunae]|uniref:CRP/FNR family transcriptional regulator, anaerobic regulatory protein n=1 Tax=Filimonas lacunae TaxID=477680 RepID=A0A173MIH3_9BACT|nr:Crp/Fnr family transcriptional regulator [Filimonas lacunae]BAV07221.1 transcriptional regulator, Crp/Fnr family [Filimonas lacunae]SIS93048.1 CRP/FNR family transcriptional regulator, anaerobic regulatory protein [Filimonas lacunae]